MSNNVKKSKKDDNELVAFFKDVNYYLRVKLQLDMFQSYSIILSIIVLPLSYLFGFDGEKILAWKIIFFFTIILDIFVIIYSIKIKKKKKTKNILDVSDIQTLEELDKITWQDFERFVQLLLKDWGYHVDPTQATHDQGADMIVEKNNIDYVVEVKQRTRARINTDILNKIVTHAKKIYKTNKAWLVTNSYLNSDALTYYNMNKDILLVTDRTDIRKYLRRKRNK